VSITPDYRCTVRELAAMFTYCLHPTPPKGEIWTPKMVDRHGFGAPHCCALQISVATWCRPDAAHDFSTDPIRGQWVANARVVRLNPRAVRRQRNTDQRCLCLNVRAAA
jgi:hypothetical protein